MSDPFNTSINVLSTHVESKEWISSSQLTLSSSLKNFCKDAFNGYFLAGMTMGRAAGIVMKCESFSIFSRFFGNSWGTKALAGGMGLAMEGTLFHIAPPLGWSNNGRERQYLITRCYVNRRFPRKDQHFELGAVYEACRERWSCLSACPPAGAPGSQIPVRK